LSECESKENTSPSLRRFVLPSVSDVMEFRTNAIVATPLTPLALKKRENLRLVKKCHTGLARPP
jgi:hypothetical protein